MPAHVLPDFVAPMLAKSGEPFDSDEYSFEIKWDGFRAIAMRDRESLRLPSRRKNEQLGRFPELDCLEQLPPGTVLDGEIVALKDGRPDFELLLGREGIRGKRRVAELSRSTPVTYVAFDLLYDDYDNWMPRPLEERRDRLQELIGELGVPLLAFSDAVVGQGRVFYEQACDQELEGVIAKRLGSRYLPGKRADSWVKIKRVQRIHCAILGWTQSDTGSFRSLVLASDVDGQLRYCGRVGSGFPAGLRDRLEQLMAARQRDEPLIACDLEAEWIEPGLYCTVSFLEHTTSGMLRAARFDELIVEDE